MVERMSAADAAPLHRERPTAPQHVGELTVFASPSSGFDYERLIRLLEERIALAPRYRQKIRMVPRNLSTPVWVDDPAFDITYHVRRSALPRPGTDAQLLEFCARIQSRCLDRGRPLWEMYLVEGLSGDRVAIVTKTHESMVDERGGIDIAQVILDAAPEPRRAVVGRWIPTPEPTTVEVIRDAVVDLVRHPMGLTTTARVAARDAGQTVGRAARLLGIASTVTGALIRRGSPSPLQAELGQQRRVAIARTRLADYRAVRSAFGGSVNDVVLSVVTGALRGWLLSRAESLDPAATVRALVPVSVLPEPGFAGPSGAGFAHASGGAALDDPVSNDPSGSRVEATNGSNQDRAVEARVRPLLVDLPVGEADPTLRLTQLQYAMAGHASSGQAVGAEALATLTGFAPPTLHVLGARAATELSRRMFDLVVTNVPGPQVPLYAAGARMTEIFPLLPLLPGQVMSVALTSYDGGVYFGINGDRDAFSDIAVFAELIEEALADLVHAADRALRAQERSKRR